MVKFTAFERSLDKNYRSLLDSVYSLNVYEFIKMMAKKHKLSNIKRLWFYLHKSAISFKKFHYGNEFFMRFWEFIQSGLIKSNSYPAQKEILNYITSRNMRRTLIPSDFMSLNKVSTQQSKVNFSNEKETVGLVPLNFQQCKKYTAYPTSLNILKFHSRAMLLGNLVSKQFTKKETQEELEISWGGPEIYKLITFIKNFDETVEKHSEVLVFFSAYWCQHCQRFRKPFGSAALMAKEANLPIVFATFDVTTDPDVAVEKGVVGIPFITYYKEGKFVSAYRGKRTAEDLFEFVKNPPVPEPNNKKLDI